MPPDEVDAVVRYGSEADQLADVRLPRDREPAALIVVVHGGFWRQDYDRHHTDPIAADLAEHGYAVASLEYRRIGGAGGWPHTFDDVAAAIDLLPDLVGELLPAATGSRRSTTPLPVVLVGHSAGGHLALWAAGRHRLPVSSPWHRSTAPQLAGVVALAPVADLAYAHELGLDDDAAGELLGGPGPQWESRLTQADPAGLPAAAPVVVVHGDLDQHVPIELVQRYVESARSLGADVVLEIAAGAEHFALIDPVSQPWQRVLAAVARLSATQ